MRRTPADTRRWRRRCEAAMRLLAGCGGEEATVLRVGAVAQLDQDGRAAGGGEHHEPGLLHPAVLAGVDRLEIALDQLGQPGGLAQVLVELQILEDEVEAADRAGRSGSPRSAPRRSPSGPPARRPRSWPRPGSRSRSRGCRYSRGAGPASSRAGSRRGRRPRCSTRRGRPGRSGYRSCGSSSRRCPGA